MTAIPRPMGAIERLVAEDIRHLRDAEDREKVGHYARSAANQLRRAIQENQASLARELERRLETAKRLNALQKALCDITREKLKETDHGNPS